MIAEIVSNGMLSLPSALAVVGEYIYPSSNPSPNPCRIGIVPAVILIVFLGIFGLYTAKLLIDFKLNHPEVHNMGECGAELHHRCTALTRAPHRRGCWSNSLRQGRARDPLGWHGHLRHLRRSKLGSPVGPYRRDAKHKLRRDRNCFQGSRRCRRFLTMAFARLGYW